MVPEVVDPHRHASDRRCRAPRVEPPDADIRIRGQCPGDPHRDGQRDRSVEDRTLRRRQNWPASLHGCANRGRQARGRGPADGSPREPRRRSAGGHGDPSDQVPRSRLHQGSEAGGRFRGGVSRFQGGGRLAARFKRGPRIWKPRSPHSSDASRKSISNFSELPAGDPRAKQSRNRSYAASRSHLAGTARTPRPASAGHRGQGHPAGIVADVAHQPQPRRERAVGADRRSRSRRSRRR